MSQDVKKYVKTFLEPGSDTWKISYFCDAKKILPGIRLLCLKMLNGRGFDTSWLEVEHVLPVDDAMLDWVQKCR